VLRLRKRGGKKKGQGLCTKVLTEGIPSARKGKKKDSATTAEGGGKGRAGMAVKIFRSKKERKGLLPGSRGEKKGERRGGSFEKSGDMGRLLEHTPAQIEEGRRAASRERGARVGETSNCLQKKKSRGQLFRKKKGKNAAPASDDLSCARGNLEKWKKERGPEGDRVLILGRGGGGGKKRILRAGAKKKKKGLSSQNAISQIGKRKKGGKEEKTLLPSQGKKKKDCLSRKTENM